MIVHLIHLRQDQMTGLQGVAVLITPLPGKRASGVMTGQVILPPPVETILPLVQAGLLAAVHLQVHPHPQEAEVNQPHI